jgi:hypothetical protein
MGNILDEIVEKIKTHVLCLTPFIRISCHLLDNVKKIWWIQRDHK